MASTQCANGIDTWYRREVDPSGTSGVPKRGTPVAVGYVELFVTDLSVVLISHNQDWNIARLIQSVLQETSALPSVEIVLVDSASKDRTVEIAQQYPIKILRLHTNQPLSSHAGRFVGFKQTTGPAILFLDGDMELFEGWLQKALATLRTRSDVAVVDGPRIDVPLATKSHEEIAHIEPKPHYSNRNCSTETTKVGGAALYRRGTLDEVGPFNPWLCSEGEPELCLRIRHAGYKVIQLGHPVVYHYSEPPREWATVIGRWKRRLYVGTGQIIRYHLGGELFWTYIKWRAYGVVPLLVLTAGVVAISVSVIIGQPIWALIWAVPIGVVIVGDLIRQRQPVKTASALLERVFQAEGTVRGFFMKPRDPSEYPGDFDVIGPGSDPPHALT